MSTDNWLSPEELASELNIPVGTVYRWRYEGRRPVGHKIGRHLRFRRTDVEDWLAEQRDTAQAIG